MHHTLVRLGMVVGASIALAGCSTYDNYGYRGYSGVSIGYSSSSPYYGWYDGYYYPGTGYYIYDRQGSRQRWRDSDRRYWQGRRTDNRARNNWSGYHRDRHDRRDRGDRGWRR
jgi:hypothetical protein